MRKTLLLLLLPTLAACARDQGGLRADAQPTLRVADAALAGNAPEVALNVTRSILQSDPFNAAAQLTQAEALYAVGELAQAAAGYRTVLTVQPRSVQARLGLGRVMLAREEAKEAEAAFRAALALEQRAPAWSNLGIALDLQGRHAEAQAAYREALRLDPGNEGARTNTSLSIAMANGAPLPAAPVGQVQLSAAEPSPPTAQPFAPALYDRVLPPPRPALTRLTALARAGAVPAPVPATSAATVEAPVQVLAAAPSLPAAEDATGPAAQPVRPDAPLSVMPLPPRAASPTAAAPAPVPVPAPVAAAVQPAPATPAPAPAPTSPTRQAPAETGLAVLAAAPSLPTGRPPMGPSDRFDPALVPMPVVPMPVVPVPVATPTARPLPTASTRAERTETQEEGSRWLRASR